ncbi:hypothetical protein AX769_20025 [Frondihabitans sp. PAMC 28766]|nr:beta-ketoacyl synthase N-terminal-like domain-containing protein [Frondihabitans sp. PAMC 28766]AMM22016.1 hypothetical protein AX769_20025 [Frondihabitans sp. PAMC 28766]
MKPLQNRTVAVTGIGVVTPSGIGVDAFWKSLFEPAAHVNVRRVDLDTLDARRLMSHKNNKNADNVTRMAIVAADEALRDAGLVKVDADAPYPAESDTGELIDGIDHDRVAVSLGTGMGGVQTLAEQILILDKKGERLVSPHTVPMVMPNAPAGALSIRYGLRGVATTISTACAAGTDGIAAGARLIAHGTADLVIAGVPTQASPRSASPASPTCAPSPRPASRAPSTATATAWLLPRRPACSSSSLSRRRRPAAPTST